MKPPIAHPFPPDWRYEVVSELGRGGMGAVYRAVDREAGRDVAIKICLEPAENPKRAARFLREGEVTARLDHPGIVRVHSSGEIGGRLYIVYELVEGSNFSDRMPTTYLRGRIELIRDAARALGYAHANGVVHRDIKSDNILVDAQGRARVADFGLATASDTERLTRTGDMLGTPTHMSPEQLDGEVGAAGPPSDVWSLGVVLYQALTDTLPFLAPSAMELIGAILHVDPPRPSKVNGRAPRELEAVCLRTLKRDPAKRYPNGDALADDLDAWLEGRLKVPRRRGPTIAGVAVVLGLVGGGAWGASRARSTPTPQPAADGTTAARDDPKQAARERAARRARRNAARRQQAEEASRFEGVEDPSQDLTAMAVEERIDAATAWLAQHGDHPRFGQPVRAILVDAKLRRAPYVLNEKHQHSESRAWLFSEGQGFLNAHVANRKGATWVELKNGERYLPADVSFEVRPFSRQAKPRELLHRHADGAIFAAFRDPSRETGFLLGRGSGHMTLVDADLSVREFALEKGRRVGCLAADPTGQFVVVAFAGGVIEVFTWDALDAASTTAPLPAAHAQAQKGGVADVVVGSDGETVVTLGRGEDRDQIQRWRFAAGKLTLLREDRVRPLPSLVRAHPTRPWLLVAKEVEHSLTLEEVATGKVVHRFVGNDLGMPRKHEGGLAGLSVHKAHALRIQHAAFSTDGGRLYSVGSEESLSSDVRVWTCEGEPESFGQWLPTLSRPPTEPQLISLDVAPDGNRLLVETAVTVGQWSRRVFELWDVGEGP